MPGRPCFIVLDQGSSSSRAFVFSDKGDIIVRSQKTIRAEYPRPGWAEYDGVALLESQLAALKEALGGIPPDFKPCGIGIASQRSSVAFWDEATGKPLCPVLSWQDGRAQAELSAVKLSNPEVHKITGLYKTPYFSASKIAWSVKNVPAVAEAASAGRLKTGSVASYVLWHLTGGQSYSIDPTLAQRTLLFDIAALGWDSRLIGEFGLSREFLPDVRPSVGVFGRYLDIPVTAMLGDQQAALYGLGAIGKGEAALNYGTGAFLLANTGGEVVDVPGLLASVAWQDAGRGADYLIEGTVNSASSTLDWLKELGFDYKTEELDNICASSSEPALVLPALGGLGSPYWDYAVTPVIGGLSGRSRRQDIIKGAVQGIAFLVADIAHLMKGSGIPINVIKASGGLAHSEYLLQFQADILQTPVAGTEQTETTALGVARKMAAFAGIDWKSGWRTAAEKIFLPKITSVEASALLARWKDFFGKAKLIRG